MIQGFGPFLATSFFCSLFGVRSGKVRKEVKTLSEQSIVNNPINSLKERDIKPIRPDGF